MQKPLFFFAGVFLFAACASDPAVQHSAAAADFQTVSLEDFQARLGGIDRTLDSKARKRRDSEYSKAPR